jgi:hypothetical protein
VNYNQAMTWQKTHRKGTNQPLYFRSLFGENVFSPSYAFLSQDYWPYVSRCKQEKVQPLSAEEYYNAMLNKEV